MSKKIKLKDLLNENFSGTLMGGVVSRTPFHTDQSLSKIVKEKYGDVDGQSVDVKGLTTELAQYNKQQRTNYWNSMKCVKEMIGLL